MTISLYCDSENALQRAAACDEVEDENDDGEDDEEMNPSAEGVAADQAQQPEDEENDGDGPKHCFFLGSARR